MTQDMSSDVNFDEYDVVVVGFGTAGISAAITAHDAGASVVMLDKAPEPTAGGNSRVSGQVWFSPTDVDGAERHLRALAGDDPVPDDLAAAWASETALNSDWVLARAGETAGNVPRDDDDPYDGDGTDIVRFSFGSLLPGGEVAEGHVEEWWELDGADCGTEYVTIGGQLGFSRLWLMLRAALEQRRVPVRYGTEMTSLVRDDADVIVGVETRHADGALGRIAARGAVVLATGGFAADPDMCRNYLPLADAVPWGSPHCTGDGIRAAQKVGADLAHPHNYMGQPGIAAPPYQAGISLIPVFSNHHIDVRADGRRFTDESIPNRHGKAWIAGRLAPHPGGEMWTVFDDECFRAGPLGLPRVLTPFGYLTQIDRYEWSADNSAELERGWITRADTPAELAALLGIDADGLDAELARYNEIAAAGVDDPLTGRRAATMSPIGPGPYYAFKWGQLLITTLGGVRKDGRARALDPDGEPIDGLYCAGDVASSYSRCLSGGMGLGDAMAFGRIAGREAAARAGHAA